MTSYSLKVTNNSIVPQTVGIFQTNPSDNVNNGLPIIFSSHSINPNGGTGLFEWQLNWGLSWGSGPTALANGVSYTATGSNILRDPSQTNQNNAVITYTNNNSWTIVGNDNPTVAGNLTTQTASNFTKQYAVDNNFTVNVTLTSDQLGTTPVFAMNGLPNYNYTFAIQPTYYVSRVYNKASVAVLGTAINGSGKIVFANNNNMQISLNDNNQWSPATPAPQAVGFAKGKPVAVAAQKNKQENDDDNPFVTSFYNKTDYCLNITKGSPMSGQDLSPRIDTKISGGTDYDYCLFNSITIDIYDQDDIKNGNHLGTADVSVEVSPNGDRYLLDKNNILIFTWNKDKSEYKGNDPWKYRTAEDITAPSISIGPPIITNNGWKNGMNNQSSEATEKESFWVQDYGMNEKGRWYPKNGALYQSTKKVTQNSDNCGSRAYPIYLSSCKPTWQIGNNAPGIAFDGCWQIQMKCGSNGEPPFCETFYLAERTNLEPGPSNYYDGAGGGNNKKYSREIDIMETRWQPYGPQANCPKGNGTAWNTDWSNKLMGKWSDIGPLPMTDFVIFGCLIRDNKLWIYGYKYDNKQRWYCSEAIENNNPNYKQQHPFVPYIGTWTDGHEEGDFATGYNNFVYLKQDDPKIIGKNPKDNPDVFGGNLNN